MFEFGERMPCVGKGLQRFCVRGLWALAGVLALASACGGDGEGSDPDAERQYLQAFCSMMDRQGQAMAPYDDDAAAILAHLPGAVEKSLQTLQGLDVPPSLTPFHEIWVEIYSLALAQDLSGVTVTAPEDAYRVFFEQPVRDAPDPRTVPADVQQRIVDLAPEIPECPGSFAASLGYATPTPD